MFVLAQWSNSNAAVAQGKSILSKGDSDLHCINWNCNVLLFLFNNAGVVYIYDFHCIIKYKRIAVLPLINFSFLLNRLMKL